MGTLDVKLSVFQHFSDPVVMKDTAMFVATYNFAKEIIRHGGKVYLEYRFDDNSPPIPMHTFTNEDEFRVYVNGLIDAHDTQTGHNQ
jgi:hypothetical protein